MFRVNLYRNVQVSEYRGKDIFSPERQENKGTNESEFGEGSERVRRRFGESSEKNISELNETQRNILEMVQQNNRISARNVAEVLAISNRSVEKNIKILKDRGILMRYGSPKSGYWKIIRNEDFPD
ncbi:MAG: winged helix-turn-helix transcriptional regulator [Lachnospiraceae bacterium]|nr:winged helix-turn-helix transcriptional regulator [Lachnospiraceae bacterium]